MLTEELLPESQAVDTQTLHTLLISCFIRLLLRTTSPDMLALDQTSGHKKPLKGLDSHERVIIEDRQVFNHLFGLFKVFSGRSSNDIYVQTLSGRR